MLAFQGDTVSCDKKKNNNFFLFDNQPYNRDCQKNLIYDFGLNFVWVF